MILEKLLYRNHLNETFDLAADGIFVEQSDLHDYAWTATKKNNRISSLDREVTSRKLPVTILCRTEAEGIAARNRLFEVTEKDVLALQPGRLIVGDYYFRCYVTASAKSDYLITGRYMKTSLTLTADRPTWTKESLHLFRSSSAAMARTLDYAYDYPFDWYSGMGAGKMVNTGFVGSDFRMILYGPCVNPAVYIGGHLYQVNCEISASEHLIVDSAAKTVVLTRNNGTLVNLFGSRSREAYLFRPVPAGTNQVLWNGSFDFDITLLEERSEPKWT